MTDKVMTEDELVRHYEGDTLYISTTKGDMSRINLQRKVTTLDNDNELTHAIEYRLDYGPIGDDGERELVHRSVHVQLKKNVSAQSVAAQF